MPSIFNFAVQNGSENMHTVLHQRKAVPQIPRSPRFDFRVPYIRDKRGKMDEFEETVIFSKERLEDRRRNP